jgi:outer membrane immunogenic protein
MIRKTLAFMLFGLAAPAAAAGFHVDGHGGVDRLSGGGESAGGATYGLAVGYDLIRGGGFLGIELTADASDTKDCERDVFIAGDRGCVEARADTALVGRAGANIGRSTQLYALAGYALADIRASYRVGSTRSTESEELDGVRLGAGIQTGITRTLSAKLEYRYTNYERDFSRHQGLLGLSLAF